MGLTIKEALKKYGVTALRYNAALEKMIESSTDVLLSDRKAFFAVLETIDEASEKDESNEEIIKIKNKKGGKGKCTE